MEKTEQEPEKGQAERAQDRRRRLHHQAFRGRGTDPSYPEYITACAQDRPGTDHDRGFRIPLRRAHAQRLRRFQPDDPQESGAAEIPARAQEYRPEAGKDPEGPLGEGHS